MSRYYNIPRVFWKVDGVQANVIIERLLPLDFTAESTTKLQSYCLAVSLLTKNDREREIPGSSLVGRLLSDVFLLNSCELGSSGSRHGLNSWQFKGLLQPQLHLVGVLVTILTDQGLVMKKRETTWAVPVNNIPQDWKIGETYDSGYK
ncbi:hypothetical protein VNO78_07973 [Psophocarpus tetragonolobus]|uniref:Uncharacterized protein n=1 Tax=Psophocarpus tetragonolobus TaxID=3891 RepID=A0AAN9SX39_PSOTE